MRVGSLRDSQHLPEEWVEGRDINTSDAVVRYLGVFLGASERVAKEWEKKVTAKMQARYDRWISRGAPTTRRGRNIVIRNHVNSLAWYLVQAQTPPQLPQMMDEWRRMGWRFFEMGVNGGGEGQRGRSAVERHTLIQCRDWHAMPRCRAFCQGPVHALDGYGDGSQSF